MADIKELYNVSDCMMAESIKKAEQQQLKKDERFDCYMRSTPCHMDQKQKDVCKELEFWKNNYSSGKSQCFIPDEKNYKNFTKCQGYDCLPELQKDLNNEWNKSNINWDRRDNKANRESSLPVANCQNIGSNSLNGEFVLQPCKNNTWKNYQTCDSMKCCSKKHQMFDNWTKRGGIEDN
jgi:hypothetical protein